MFLRFVTVAMLALSLLATAGSAQTAAELLQKGIYTQETAGDLDAAIRIYRQVITSAGAPRPLAAQAQMRIVGVLLQKGDTAGASLEFNILVQNYADQKEIIASIAARLGGSGQILPQVALGKLENGRYHHNQTGVEFNLPPGWSIESEGPSSDNGEITILADSKEHFTAVWLKRDVTPAAFIGDALRGAIPQKIHQRTEFQDYRLRPDSIQSGQIGGQQSMRAVADYVEDGTKMAECLTWIYTEKTRVFFFSRIAASDLPSFQPRLDQIISTALVP